MLFVLSFVHCGSLLQKQHIHAEGRFLLSLLWSEMENSEKKDLLLQCSDHLYPALYNHASNILLHFIMLSIIPMVYEKKQ